MPRFLDTLTGQFVWKEHPTNVVYAILSHTWRSAEEGGEQSYEDVRKLQAEVSARNAPLHPLSMKDNRVQLDPSEYTGGLFSHPALSDKIRGSCRIAREAGYRFIWNDACCIDKASSAELTEAINSMFQWYRLADVCYVFLADVPDEDPFGVHFQRSRWHRRGWTLQELIAPKRVVFCTRTWRILGTKFGLAPTLEKITNIDFNVLTGRATLSSISVARRMSWAAPRETTRVEDRAYSLMGIFSVHMPTIYGEGSNAFLRLQEEIIKTIPDQSVFAWGRACVLRSLRTKDDRMPGHTDSYGLLADSPSAFFDSGDIHPMSSADFASCLGRGREAVPSLHSVFTPKGVRMELPCIDLAQVPDLRQTFMIPRYPGINQAECEDCAQLGRAHVLALLQCTDEDGALISLPLCAPNSELGARYGLLVVTYINCAMYLHQPVRTVRLTRCALEEAFERLSTGPEPMSLSILRHYSRSMVPDLSQDYPFHPRGPSSTVRNFWKPVYQGGCDVFQIAPHSKQELAVLGFILAPLQCWRFAGEVDLLTTLLRDSRDGRWERRPRGTTELKVTLIKNDDGYDNFSAAVRFSVTNRQCIIFADTDKRSPAESDRYRSPSSFHHITQEMPFPESSGGTSTLVSGISCGPLLTNRTLASTMFLICWYTDEPGRQDVLNRRLLRLALERSAVATRPNDFRDLWIAVEISDGYWSWNGPVDVDGGDNKLGPSDISASRVGSDECSIHEALGPTVPKGPKTKTKTMASYAGPVLNIWRRWSRRTEQSSRSVSQTHHASSDPGQESG
ncbi:Vegetative incompatibility protein HET-E-1 [Trametes pubescens]|uniref:Vegetative incompatibility protein HET-E-1 n=1 Tax=Trametes pubescens TaxID=154538 RepID=A0A1M2W122_TRAPU|nr:Vegetative incompatibility protein HET-E-1 [Trametes pubescens]